MSVIDTLPKLQKESVLKLASEIICPILPNPPFAQPGVDGEIVLFAMMRTCRTAESIRTARDDRRLALGQLTRELQGRGLVWVRKPSLSFWMSGEVP